MIKEPKTPEEWEAQGDAYTLMRAEEIRQDTTRLKKALNWIEVLAEETQNKAKAVNSLLKESKKLKENFQ
jgi:NADH:ubiquinone oxidoreductase subunit D